LGIGRDRKGYVGSKVEPPPPLEWLVTGLMFDVICTRACCFTMKLAPNALLVSGTVVDDEKWSCDLLEWLISGSVCQCRL